jgi:hypothetical protein
LWCGRHGERIFIEFEVKVEVTKKGETAYMQWD